ncbi:Gfo/Idh/MocA family protein [Sinomicrobium weinanense]|uniref:Gfo/Idh/MocA family oxidoreductase n=1 Tax=Sinomicrobium weinanense TaxID=2842200 RepID=A0A926JTY5_9FLAO|nr:Gfo/Idh/MocA family oxidoreductase [Sinomicrobium weinanense]MBC9797490.1 Gfo/Idh/MocA family oxidoreductase [Sinomicrobium weinanense]MBU3122224.1 Gfo/Idh/MocA family oxidoreductase [Sinomicrobium weinanense]
MKKTLLLSRKWYVLALVLSFHFLSGQNKVLDVAVAGMNHDHIHVLLNQYRQHRVNIVGIAEPDKQLIRRLQKDYQLPDSLFYDNVAGMLNKVHPDAVLAYNPIAGHVDVAEACLPLKIPLMVEKPLAVNNKQARRIARLSEANNTPVFTNYETTWYGSNQVLKTLLHEQGFGPVKKMIARDGHQGPEEIGCSAEFLSWLTDPVSNGAGALTDFGCYGANLMTWLMDGERPVAVTAVTRQLKPHIYPDVDDDATIIVEYGNGATGIIQASWNWPYSIKDLQVYGPKTSLHAVNGETLVRYEEMPKGREIPVKGDYFKDQVSFLEAALAGKKLPENHLSSLENNLIVVEILEAAKASALRGERIEL